MVSGTGRRLILDFATSITASNRMPNREQVGQRSAH